MERKQTWPVARPPFPLPHLPLRGPKAAVNHSETSNSLLLFPFSGTPAHTTALFVLSSVLKTIADIPCPYTTPYF